MAKIMPSQVVQTIDELFPAAAKGVGSLPLQAGHSFMLRGVLNLVKEIPPELIALPPDECADLVLATSTIEEHLSIWISRGPVGGMANVKGRDAITVIRRTLSNCPDELPPPSTTELGVINNDNLRASIRGDVGAANRAINNWNGRPQP